MPNFYNTVISPVIRYDERLTPNAKLFYSEIKALCNEKDSCTLKQNHYAKLYSVTDKSVSNWITQLIDCGYITKKEIPGAVQITLSGHEQAFETRGVLSD